LEVRHVTPADGNIFADLGFPPAEAQSLLARATLMARIRDVVTDRKLTQVRAARLFGVTQPRMSDLVRGRIERFSVDTLMDMLARAGMEVRVHVKPKAA
jgi:predicted XRE-type DNA-binding protein